MKTISGSDSWRSSQPSPDDLRYAAAQGVKTVLCLRKATPGRPWYDEEAAVCREIGLNLRVLHWSALNSSQKQIDALIDALSELPPPYLIHCKHGVDRTGLAAAVLRVVVLGHSKKRAASELSILNGHLPVFATRAMDRAWKRFRWPRAQNELAAGTTAGP